MADQQHLCNLSARHRRKKSVSVFAYRTLKRLQQAHDIDVAIGDMAE